MTLYAFCTHQAIANSVFAHIRVAVPAPQQSVPFNTEDMIRSCDPQPSTSVFCDSEYRLAQRLLHLERDLNMIRNKEGDPGSTADPQYTGGIRQYAIEAG
jgi:hypothetical protein